MTNVLALSLSPESAATQANLEHNEMFYFSCMYLINKSVTVSPNNIGRSTGLVAQSVM
jgi:hypothetical protein